MKSNGSTKTLPIDYEGTCDIMGIVLAYYAKKINDEENKAAPGKEKLDDLDKKFVEVFRTQRDLRADDSEKIKALCDYYAPMARTILAGGDL